MTSSRDDANVSNGYSEDDVHEVQIPVPWGHISGKWWGSTSDQPIVALHGWQDNCGTFDSLAPLLTTHSAVLSIDLPGHGHSSHLPSGQFYYVFWDGVLYLRRIVKHYNWQKVKLMGHSLGGAISFLYAATFPDEVEFIICLDIVSPTVRTVEQIAPQVGTQIDRFFKFENLTEDKVPCYEYEEMITIVEQAYNGALTRKSAEVMMRRGMQPASKPNFYNFSRDPRLKVSILGMITLELSTEYARRIKCGYLNIRAVPGMKFDHPESYEIVLEEIRKATPVFKYQEVEGSHHVHLNEPEKVAPIINDFVNLFETPENTT